MVHAAAASPPAAMSQYAACAHATRARSHRKPSLHRCSFNDTHRVSYELCTRAPEQRLAVDEFQGRHHPRLPALALRLQR
jgi:hypothetical protein